MDDLKTAAEEVLKNSYVPHSGVRVACALDTDAGVFTGVNIEVGCGATMCAERIGFMKAISEGARQFYRISVVSDLDDIVPCGICRHYMNAFCDPDFKIEYSGQRTTLRELLPGEKDSISKTRFQEV